MLFAGPRSESRPWEGICAQHSVTLRAALQYFISGKCSISTAAGPVPCWQPLERSAGAPCQDAPFLSSGMLHSHPAAQLCWWQEVNEAHHIPSWLLCPGEWRGELPGEWAAKGGVVERQGVAARV